MLLDAPTNSTVIAEYRQRTPRSAELARAARELFPSGITHDGRFLRPYGIYVDAGKAGRKWDVDGNEYVDYFGGHGALLLGQCHPRAPRRSPRARSSAPTRRARFAGDRRSSG